MELNRKKCKEMFISFLKYNIATINPIYVFGSRIATVSSFKLLGLTLSIDLSWNLHVDNVFKKANSRLYALRLLKRAELRQSDLVEMYCLFIRSSAEYAAPAWSNMTVNLSDLIENIQKRSLRIIYPGILAWEPFKSFGYFTSYVAMGWTLYATSAVLFKSLLARDSIHFYDEPFRIYRPASRFAILFCESCPAYSYLHLHLNKSHEK